MLQHDLQQYWVVEAVQFPAKGGVSWGEVSGAMLRKGSEPRLKASLVGAGVGKQTVTTLKTQWDL